MPSPGPCAAVYSPRRAARSHSARWQQGFLGRLGRWPPHLARSPMPAAGWRGRTKNATAQGSGDPKSDISGHLNSSRSVGRRPVRATGRPRGTRSPARRRGRSAGDTVHGGVGYLLHCLLLRAAQSRKHHVGLEEHPLQHHPLRLKLVKTVRRTSCVTSRHRSNVWSPSISTSGSMTGTRPASWHSAP